MRQAFLVALAVLTVVAGGVPGGALADGGADGPPVSLVADDASTEAETATTVTVSVTGPEVNQLRNLTIGINETDTAIIKRIRVEGPGTAHIHNDRVTWTSPRPVAPERVVIKVVVMGVESGAAELTVSGGTARNFSTRRIGIDGASATISVADAADSRLDGFEVRDETHDLTVDQTATVPIRATANHGLGAADVDVVVPESVTVESVSVPADFGSTNRGGVLSIAGVGYGYSTGGVIAELEMTATATGTASVVVDATAAGTPAAESYATDAAGGTLTLNVSEQTDNPPALGGDGEATDPDDDGVFEDVNGDGRTTVVDASTLLNHRNEAPPAFDVTGDGRVSVVDVSALLSEVSG